MEKITYKKSFAAKLILSQETIPHYQAIKDLCATRKRVSTRLSFSKETISVGRTKVAVIKLAVKHLSLHLALDPKEFEGTKYRFKDVSEKKQGQIYPMVVSIKSNRGLKYALELLEMALSKAGAIQLCLAEDIDYHEMFYPRSFEALLEEGLIKKYVKTLAEGEEALEEDVLEDELIEDEEEEDGEEEDSTEVLELCNVHFTAKLLYEAVGAAGDLYIVTSFNNWNPDEAVKMHRNADDTFTASMSFPKGTALEFKICRSKNWMDVEKGIWKEEIVNHNYILVDKDLAVEDLIYNFRQE